MALTLWTRETMEKKWGYIKLKTSAQQRKRPSNQKGDLLRGRRYLPVVYPVREWHPKYIKKSYNSIEKKKAIQFKNGQKI